MKITEAEFTDRTVALFRACGWLVHHDRPARTDQGYRTAIQGNAGFPDLVAIRAGHLVVAELKVGRGKTTPAQDRWLRSFQMVEDRGTGLIVRLWRPEHQPEIEAVAKTIHMSPFPTSSS